jgi:hypothetical protein
MAAASGDADLSSNHDALTTDDQPELLSSALKIQAACRGRQGRREAAAARARALAEQQSADTATEIMRIDWTAEAIEALNEDVAVELCETEGLPWEDMEGLADLHEALKQHFNISRSISEDISDERSEVTSDVLEVRPPISTSGMGPGAAVAQPIDEPTVPAASIDRNRREQAMLLMRVRELESLAHSIGLGQDAIDEALDSEKPKQALVAVIVQAQEQSATVSGTVPEASPEPVLSFGQASEEAEMQEGQTAEQAEEARRESEMQRLQLQTAREAEQRAEEDRLAAVAAEQEAAEAAAEEDRLAAEAAAEEDRLAAVAAEQEAAEALAEEDRLAAEAAEQDRLAAEAAAEEDRLAAETAEQDRLAAEAAAEEDRLAAEAAEEDRLAAEAAEQDRLAAEAEKEKADEKRTAEQAREDTTKARLAGGTTRERLGEVTAKQNELAPAEVDAELAVESGVGEQQIRPQTGTAAPVIAQERVWTSSQEHQVPVPDRLAAATAEPERPAAPSVSPGEVLTGRPRATEYLEVLWPRFRVGLTALNDARPDHDPVGFLAAALERSHGSPEVPTESRHGSGSGSGMAGGGSLTMLSYCAATVRPALLSALSAANTQRPEDPVVFVADHLRRHAAHGDPE